MDREQVWNEAIAAALAAAAAAVPEADARVIGSPTYAVLCRVSDALKALEIK